MDPQNGQFSVTKKLDYEAGQFYLFNIIVTVIIKIRKSFKKYATKTDLVCVQDKGGLTGSIQVALNVIDEKDSAPVWKLEVPFINIPEERPVVSISNHSKSNWSLF